MSIVRLEKIQKLPYFIVGPCALESWDQIELVATLVKKFKLSYLRSFLYKSRTHPDSFQGLHQQGFSYLQKLQDDNLKLVVEVASESQLQEVLPFCSIVQIGARNMQNFELLKSVGQEVAKLKDKQEMTPKVLVKRGFSSTFHEWLSAALYLERYGLKHEDIILCERGSRNFASPSGVTLDLQMALKAKLESPYAVIADPSHGTRDRRHVLYMAEAALALPLDGLMLEVHPDPQKALSDSHQTISLIELENFIEGKFSY